MLWVFAIVIVVVIGGIAVVAAGRGGLAPAHEDRPDVAVAAGRPLRAEDLRTVRFTVGVRGYRMDEVDSLLDRLADELAERDRPAPPPPLPEPHRQAT